MKARHVIAVLLFTSMLTYAEQQESEAAAEAEAQTEEAVAVASEKEAEQETAPAAETSTDEAQEAAPATAASSPADNQIKVSRVAVAPSIENREPEGAGDQFSSDIGRLYCFSHIEGAVDSTKITHNWYFNDELQSAVTLGVNSPSWRTFSAKQISEEETGSWHVEIIHGESDVLETINFTIE
ncbi:DUF2914 domain-containing protein [Chitinispirillales bacterium ANBcel5]|uniref:DUF2914 domain-containing protein n=1 Tax=Cellulosispirillum alkaliphilum TaxID=3039283 RepID=UPI002A56AF83|nr:DUF2914 domain-containing protein [Chitinispirillales bacterium ANBcel5]